MCRLHYAVSPYVDLGATAMTSIRCIIKHSAAQSAEMCQACAQMSYAPYYCISSRPIIGFVLLATRHRAVAVYVSYNPYNSPALLCMSILLHYSRCLDTPLCYQLGPPATVLSIGTPPPNTHTTPTHRTLDACSYTPSTPHSRLLLQALVQLAGPDSLIFLALSLHHNPEEVHAFLKWAETDWGFAVEHITEGIPVEYVVPDVLVVKLQLQDQRKAATAGVAAAGGALRRWDE